MNDVTAVQITLVINKIVLLLIGFFAAKRTRDKTNYFLGWRMVGPFLAAISASASSSSVWTILGVSGAAYAWFFRCGGKKRGPCHLPIFGFSIPFWFSRL